LSPRPSPSRGPGGADEEPAERAGGGLNLRGGVWRSLVALLLVVLFIYAYRESGLWENPEGLRAAGGPRAAVIIFFIMAGAWL
jgi:hypothetical protein